MFCNRVDSNTHSDSSSRGCHSVTFLCEQAVLKGLVGIAITDSCEIDRLQSSQYDLRIIQSHFEAAKAKVVFQQQLSVTSGIELGQAVDNLPAAERAIAACSFDVVLATERLAARLKEQEAKGEDLGNPDALLQTYLQRVYETVQWGKFDVLSGFLLPLSFFRTRGIPFDAAGIQAPIREILSLLAKKGIGLEITTAPLRMGDREVSPSQEVARWFWELGGQYVTIGSTSYDAYTVGDGIDVAMEMLTQVGYKYFAYYRQRKPVMLNML